MKRSNFLLGLSLLLLTVPFCGCEVVSSLHSLRPDTDVWHPVHEPRIDGEWVGVNFYGWQAKPLDRFQNTDATIVSPQAEWDGTYSVTFRRSKEISGPGPQSYVYDFSLVQLGDHLYFDAEFSKLQQDQFEFNRANMNVLAAAPAHFLGRLTIEEEFLRAEAINPDWVSDNVPEGDQEKVSIDKHTDVTTLLYSTRDLRELLLKTTDPKLFVPMGYLCRPGKDCATLAIEDLVHLLPNDADTIETAADFYVVRRNYARAGTAATACCETPRFLSLSWRAGRHISVPA